MNVKDDITLTVGNTPLVRVRKTIPQTANIFAKMECMNPFSSVKDRVAISMVDAAENAGLLVRGKGVIIEPTSGNTGIGLAMVAAARGYKCILSMPESMSIERRKVLRALGCELILTPAAEGMTGAIRAAEEFVTQNPQAYMPQQFNNPANPQIHRLTTAPEIWRDTDGKVDIFISSVGTGGTLTGVGEVLKKHNPAIKVIAVEPDASPVISQTLMGQTPTPGPHMLQGIGAGFIPKVLNLNIIDEVIRVKNEDAFEYARKAARDEALFVGISSGAALKAAAVLAEREENRGKNIVAIMPSFGERYLSSPLFANID
ncbi:MAG TPA: cysteine synthase A [Phycisphaerae bacterium]|nr:cysteine synthase A [Phycisphaerae bacterium]HPS52938.1 cysteine synthase A [Phycisphaerae bacterium]